MKKAPSSFVRPGALSLLAWSCYCHVISMTIVLGFLRGSVGLNLRAHSKPGRAFIYVDLKEP